MPDTETEISKGSGRASEDRIDHELKEDDVTQQPIFFPIDSYHQRDMEPKSGLKSLQRILNLNSKDIKPKKEKKTKISRKLFF